MLFVGEFKHSIDSQRRVAIPSEWRGKGESVFYVLPWRHNTLQLMTFDSFRSLADKLRKVPTADPKAMIALARLGAKARECKCDKQGRIALIESMLEYAEIKKKEALDSELYLVGAFNSIQIWSVDNWNKLQSMSNQEDTLDVFQKIEEMPDSLTDILKAIKK
jgi:MraZ protein